MAVVFTAGTVSEATASVTSATVTLPASLAAGDYVFLFCTLNASSGTITGPAGYTALFPSAQSSASSSHSTAIFYRLWQSGDGNPVVTCTNGRLAVLPCRVRGADTVDILDGAYATQSPAVSGTDVDAPTQTSTSSKLLVTVHAGRTSSAGDIITFTPPAGMTEVGEAKGQAATQTNAGLAVNTLVITAGATTGTKTGVANLSLTGSRGISFLLDEANTTTTVGSTRATTWRTLAVVAETQATSWTVRTPVGETMATSWAVRTPVTTSRSTLWNTLSLGTVVVSRGTSWTVRTPVGASTRSTSWTVRTTVAASTRSTSWSLGVLVLPTGGITTPGMRLRSYLPIGADQGLLPAPQDGQVSYPLNDVGALRFSYLARAPRSSLLESPCEIAVELSPDSGITWFEPPNSRFVYLTDGADPVDPKKKYTVDARGYVWRLSKATIDSNNLLNPDGKREFLSKNVGIVLKTLFAEAQARGALSGITHTSFSTTLDSSGAAWNSVFTKYYSPGLDYLTVLQDLADAGWCDYRMVGRALYVYNADTTLSVDRHTTVVLRPGRDLTEAPYTRTWEALADSAYFLGDGVEYRYTNPGASTPWGRQEIFISNGSVSDPGTMAVLTQAELSQRDVERIEYVRGLNFTRSTVRPFTDYQVGDFLGSTTDGSVPTSLRLRQLTLELDNNGIVSGNVTLNDRFLEADVRARRRVEGITNGASSGPGTGTPPTTDPPSLGPGTVTGLSGSSAAYMGPGGFPQAQVTLNWNPITVNADGSPMSDLDRYEIFQRPLGQALSLAKQVASTSDTTIDMSPYQVGSSWTFNVRAVDNDGNFGAKSADANVGMATDTVPPQTPSTPIVTARLGIVSIYWDGAPATGTWPEDFDYIEVHVSTVNNFTPTTATLYDVLYGESASIYTGGAYGVPIYAKFIAVDKTPLKSGASAQGTATPAQLVNTDLITNIVDTRLLADGAVDQAAIQNLAVGTANMIDASVVNAKIGNLAVNSAKISDLDVGKLTAGTLSADVLVAARLMTATSGSRVLMDSTGIRLFKGAATTPVVFLDPTPGQLRITNTTDASHTSTGHGIQFGPDNATNLIIDDNEIMVRFNGSYGGLNLNREGGAISMGGVPGGWPVVDEPDASYGTTPANDDHLITLRGTVYLPTARDGAYDDEYAPLMIGRRGNQHLWFGISSLGSTTADSPAALYLNPPVAGGANHLVPVWLGSNSMAIRRIGPAQGGMISTEASAALQFISNQINARDAAISGNRSMGASAFNVLSMGSSKKDIVDIPDAVAMVKGTKSRKWKFRDEINPDGTTHFGPILEDLPPEMHVRIGEDQFGYDLSSLVGVLWEAVRTLTARLEVLEDKKKPEGTK